MNENPFDIEMNGFYEKPKKKHQLRKKELPTIQEEQLLQETPQEVRALQQPLPQQEYHETTTPKRWKELIIAAVLLTLIAVSLVIIYGIVTGKFETRIEQPINNNNDVQVPVNNQYNNTFDNTFNNPVDLQVPLNIVIENIHVTCDDGGCTGSTTTTSGNQTP